MSTTSTKATRYATIAENYEQDKDAGTPAHLIVPDDKRRYCIKAILKEGECQALLAFIRTSEVSQSDVALTSALSKVAEGLKVMGFSSE